METSVDPAALQSAAQRLDAAADLLHGALTIHLGGLCSDDGAGIRTALDQLAADVALWRRAATETATALRAAARRYTEAEAQAAQALR